MREAFQRNRFESVSGAAEHPSGGDVIISRRSDMSRELAELLGRGAETIEAADEGAAGVDVISPQTTKRATKNLGQVEEFEPRRR